MEANFCRRCGSQLTNQKGHVFICAKGHVLFMNASPATNVIFINDERKILFVKRASEPGKGMLDFPGGFCDGAETFEDSLARELKEELGLQPDHYETPQYLTTVVSDYEYKGEMLQVLVGVFWSKISSDAPIKPADDVAGVALLGYDEIDESKVYWPELLVGTDLLHAQGII